VNAWWNLAPHDVSILLYLMDGRMPDSISARGVDYIQPGIEDVVFAVLTWDTRVTAHVHVSWLDPGKVRKVTLVGERKMVVYNDVSEDKIAVFDKGVDLIPRAGDRMDYDQANPYRLIHRAGDVSLPRIDFQEPLKVEASHFLESVRTGLSPLTGPRHARDVVAILEAGGRSLREGGSPVRLDEIGS
jgi:predicted dehydrogenase